MTSPPINFRAVSESVIQLGKLCLAFGRVNRITYHPDGETLESDTDHTVMLGVVACAFADQYLPQLDLGLVAQYSLVHDLVEVYAGDTPTLHQLSKAEKQQKEEREGRAQQRLARQFKDNLPWVGNSIREYEDRQTPEARYVKAMDKLLPKITHILNEGQTLDDQRMSRIELRDRYDAQFHELEAYASDFKPLFDLRAELIEEVMLVWEPDILPT